MKEFIEPGFIVLVILFTMLVGTSRLLLRTLFGRRRSRSTWQFIHFVSQFILSWRSPTPLSSYTARQLRDELERREAKGIHDRESR